MTKNLKKNKVTPHVALRYERFQLRKEMQEIETELKDKVHDTVQPFQQIAHFVKKGKDIVTNIRQKTSLKNLLRKG